ncbi:MAG: hypothetical protein KDD43_04765, partial [Bdellovibrionales bacterium]|nr:hypothetical protein [Bdellovibrionales bacterium]
KDMSERHKEMKRKERMNKLPLGLCGSVHIGLMSLDEAEAQHKEMKAWEDMKREERRQLEIERNQLLRFAEPKCKLNVANDKSEFESRGNTFYSGPPFGIIPDPKEMEDLVNRFKNMKDNPGQPYWIDEKTLKVARDFWEAGIELNKEELLRLKELYSMQEDMQDFGDQITEIKIGRLKSGPGYNNVKLELTASVLEGQNYEEVLQYLSDKLDRHLDGPEDFPPGEDHKPVDYPTDIPF